MKPKFTRTLTIERPPKYENEHTRLQEEMGRSLQTSAPNVRVGKPQRRKSPRPKKKHKIVAHDNFGRPLVECKICGATTVHLNTVMCDLCWELDSRIRMNLPVAEKIVAFYKAKNK